jgi:triacylglycerol lipase
MGQSTKGVAMTGISFNAAAIGYDAQDALTLGHCADVAYLPDLSGIATEMALRFTVSDAVVKLFVSDNIQAYAFNGPKEIVVAFRGTEPAVLRDWYTDFDSRLIACPLSGAGRVHDGFWCGAERVWSDLRTLLLAWSAPAKPIWICGHSLGGAMALLTAVQLCCDAALHGAFCGLYTYGQPRVGDSSFASFVNRTLGTRYFRFVNNLDIVPHVPPALISQYRHGGCMVYFDEDGHAVVSPSPLAEMVDDVAGEVKALMRIEPAAQITDHLMRDYLPLLEKVASLVTQAMPMAA